GIADVTVTSRPTGWVPRRGTGQAHSRRRVGSSPSGTWTRTPRPSGLVSAVAVARSARPKAAPRPVAIAFTIVPAPKQDAWALIATPPSRPAASHRSERLARSRARTPSLPGGGASRLRKLRGGSEASPFGGGG